MFYEGSFVAPACMLKLWGTGHSYLRKLQVLGPLNAGGPLNADWTYSVYNCDPNMQNLACKR